MIGVNNVSSLEQVLCRFCFGFLGRRCSTGTASSGLGRRRILGVSGRVHFGVGLGSNDRASSPHLTQGLLRMDQPMMLVHSTNWVVCNLVPLVGDAGATVVNMSWDHPGARKRYPRSAV